MGLWGDITGTDKMADAAQGTAEEANAEARRQFDITQKGVDEATGYAKEAVNMAKSPEELATLRKSLASQEQELGRQSKLFDALNPAIMEASQQALQLLQGKEAKALAPLRRQREQQRTKLLNRLRETLGPGAETSTAGMQALSQFDQQSADTLFGAQQQSMGSLFGMGMQGEMGKMQASGLRNSSIGQMANIGGMFGNAAGRVSNAQQNLANTKIGGTNAVTASGQNLINTAGSQFVGDMIQGQAQNSLFNTVVEGGLAYATGGLSSLGGGSKNKVGGPTGNSAGGSYSNYGATA